MRVDLLDYDLWPGSIAQFPSEDPLAARLLELPAEDEPSYAEVRDLPDRIPEGSLVVVNDTRVLKARLLGRKRGSGGRAEVLLVRRAAADTADASDPRAARWWALGKAS